MELDKIYCGECTEVMAGFPDACIDLTVTSPPYDKMDENFCLIPGGLRTYNGYSLDFGDLAQQLYRVTKPGGVVVWVVGDETVNGSETLTSFRQALYFRKLGFAVHDTMIYCKLNPPPVSIDAHRRYNPAFEYMFVFSLGTPKSFNPIKYTSKMAGKTRTGTWQHGGDGIYSPKHTGGVVNTNSIKSNLWTYPVGCEFGNRGKHSALFPESLARDHILSWSNPGDLVLDPMCGSGTTLKMSIETGRHYIGIDISEEYCQLAQRRVDGAKIPLFVM